MSWAKAKNNQLEGPLNRSEFGGQSDKIPFRKAFLSRQKKLHHLRRSKKCIYIRIEFPAKSDLFYISHLLLEQIFGWFLVSLLIMDHKAGFLVLSCTSSFSPAPPSSKSSVMSLETRTGKPRKVCRPRVNLDTLPFEVRQQIAQECLQADAFHLCLINSAMYESTISRLYQCIVFDSGHRHFNKETSLLKRHPGPNSDGDSDDEEDDSQYMRYTSVQTVGGLRGCLRTLARCPDKAAMVKRLETHNSLEISDLEVKERFRDVLPLLISLRSLIWHGTPEITADLLQLCQPVAKQLSVCSVHVALRQNSTSQMLRTLELSGLKHLVICPFRTSQYLSWLGEFFATSYNPKMRNRLKTLYLGRDMPQNQQVGSGFTFASMDHDNYRVDGRELRPMKAFFDPLVAKSKKFGFSSYLLAGMKMLGLNGIVASASDAMMLKGIIDLRSLTHICLVGGDSGGESMVFEPPGFLRAVGPFIRQVKHLELNWKNGPQAGWGPTEDLISDLHHLESLKINLTDFDQECLNCICSCQNLTRLTVQAVNEGVLVSMDSSWLAPLAACTKLTALKIPCTSIPRWISYLHELEILYIERSNVQPYLGHPFILSYQLEDMTRLEYLVREAKDLQPSLKYVKIEDYVFDVRSTLTVREGLDQWLDDEIFPTWEV